MAKGEQHEPGLEAALDYVSFQAAWLRSCASGRWEDVVRLTRKRWEDEDAVKRPTTAEAIVHYLAAQRIATDGAEQPLFPGVFAIFGHGNVTCLGPALEAVKDVLPTWRGQNEQGMALAAVAFAKAKRRRQIMVATSSIGPGATNMVTAAAVAHANRLPVLLISGDTFASRIPDPVLQQVEPFDDPSVTVNDAFKPVTRYWDRIMRPEQVVHSLPHAVATMLDPATCGPAFLALPQDVQGGGLRLPGALLRAHGARDPPAAAGSRQLQRAVEVLATATAPLIIAGGGVHYSFAEEELRRSPNATTSRSSRPSPARRASSPPIRSTPVRSASPAARRPTRWPARPTSCSPSARGCRTSRPARGRCSATRPCASSGSTPPASTP